MTPLSKQCVTFTTNAYLSYSTLSNYLTLWSTSVGYDTTLDVVNHVTLIVGLLLLSSLLFLFPSSMVDYSVSTAPEAFLRRKAHPFKMEELAVMALLECPLCFEQLDVTAKVLPCQHTFCMSCLQRQEASHSQLFCPECRAPVPARTLEELPANLLLVRLLEGLQGSLRPSKDRQTARHAVPLALGGREGQQQQNSQQREREKQGHNEVSTRPQPNPLHI